MFLSTHFISDGGVPRRIGGGGGGVFYVNLEGGHKCYEM